MSISDWLLAASLLLFPAFLLIERVFRARPQPRVRGWKALGVFFVLLNTAVGVGLPLLLPPEWFEYSLMHGADIGVAGGAVAGFLVLTLANYGWHRLVHRVPLMWRLFHQAHHAPRRLDVSGAFVFHPFEMAAFTLIAVVVTTLVLGLDPVAASIVGLALTFNALFQHANIPTPEWLGYIVQRPEAHSIHHAYGVHAFNYSDFPLWDMVFGTFRGAANFRPRVGFDTEKSARWWDIAVFRDVHRPDLSLAGEPARIRNE